MIDLKSEPTEILNDFTEASGGIAGIMDKIKTAKDVQGPRTDVGRKIKDGSETLDKVHGAMKDQVLDRSSIISKVSKSVMQFPVYISQSLRIAEAHTIGKAFERVYASFVQNVIAQNPVITDINKVNGLQFLRDYHTNIKESTAVTLQGLQSIFNEYCTPIDQFDEIMTESVISELNVPGGTLIFMIARPNKLLCQESARLAHEPLEGFRYLSEAGGGGGPSIGKQEVTNTNSVDITKVSNAPQAVELTDRAISGQIDDILTDLGLTSQYASLKPNQNRDKDIDLIKKTIADKAQIVSPKGNIYQSEITPEKKIYDKENKTVVRTEPEVVKFTMTRRKMEHSSQTNAQKTVTSTRSDTMQGAVDAPIAIRDTDVKKFNAMMPFQFTVKFRVNPIYDVVRKNGQAVKNDAGETEIDSSTIIGGNYEQNYILGVKTVLHVIRTKDLSDELREIITGERKGLQSIRYKTGEISWLKDYMLNLPNLKADAMKRLDDRRWLSTLKRLGEYEKLHGTMLKKSASAICDTGIPIPNATMVLTRGDVERMKDDTGINLDEIATARALAKRLYLIGVVIVDQTAGSFKVFFPDMDNDWDIQSLGSLDAEVAKIDNSPLMAEINRISRKG